MALVFLRLLVFLGLFVSIIYMLRKKFILRPLSAPLSDDPYIILGISRGASETEIKEAYHRELAKYHPDKVAHLGIELQELARTKTTAIIAAYKALERSN